ncbi:MAG: sel1 repeat family protein [Acidobacteriia bacterium]|nr:sel1 repeat family protein [Terriglobia bacterium]
MLTCTTPMQTSRWSSFALGLLVAGAILLRSQAAAPQDSQAGGRWLMAPVTNVRTAAEQGEAAAQYALGERLLRGSDGKADVIEAYQWHGRAASNGLVAAQLRMGMKHERAVAGVLDIAEAARWYELAAAQGSDAARFRGRSSGSGGQLE